MMGGALLLCFVVLLLLFFFFYSEDYSLEIGLARVWLLCVFFFYIKSDLVAGFIIALFLGFRERRVCFGEVLKSSAEYSVSYFLMLILNVICSALMFKSLYGCSAFIMLHFFP